MLVVYLPGDAFASTAEDVNVSRRICSVGSFIKCERVSGIWNTCSVIQEFISGVPSHIFMEVSFKLLVPLFTPTDDI